MGKKRVIAFENDALVTALEQTAERFHLTLSQYIEECCKKRLEALGVTWWQGMLEINAPEGD
ncbi:MAG TPA: hypothetical protein VFK94_02130 [Patescibacteria group bacterium]|nr:hypothetical protein [Patescibacteria group bacterium]